MSKKNRETHHVKRAPLWKWVVIIVLIIAMPLFFAFYRSIQLQQALQNTQPEPAQSGDNKPETTTSGEQAS